MTGVVGSMAELAAERIYGFSATISFRVDVSNHQAFLNNQTNIPALSRWKAELSPGFIHSYRLSLHQLEYFIQALVRVHPSFSFWSETAQS
jgi:hypothetical protein